MEIMQLDTDIALFMDNPWWFWILVPTLWDLDSLVCISESFDWLLGSLKRIPNSLDKIPDSFDWILDSLNWIPESLDCILDSLGPEFPWVDPGLL